MSSTDFKIWMLGADIGGKQLAAEYGKTEAFVSQFINKGKKSKPFVAFLIEKKGCPEKWFCNGRLMEVKDA